MSVLDLHPERYRRQARPFAGSPSFQNVTDGTENDGGDMEAAVWAHGKMRDAQMSEGGLRAAQMQAEGYLNDGGARANPFARRDPKNFFPETPETGASRGSPGGSGASGVGSDAYLEGVMKSISPAVRMKSELGGLSELSDGGQRQDRPSNLGPGGTMKPQAGIYAPDDNGNMATVKTFEPPIGQTKRTEEIARFVDALPMEERQKIASRAVAKKLGVTLPEESHLTAAQTAELAYKRERNVIDDKRATEDREYTRGVEKTRLERELADRENDPNRVKGKFMADTLRKLTGGNGQSAPPDAPRKNFVDDLEQAPYAETADLGGRLGGTDAVLDPRQRGSVDLSRRSPAAPEDGMSDLARELMGLPPRGEQEYQKSKRDIELETMSAALAESKRKGQGLPSIGEERAQKVEFLKEQYKMYAAQANGNPGILSALSREFYKHLNVIQKGGEVNLEALPIPEVGARQIEETAKATGFSNSKAAFEEAIDKASVRKYPGLADIGLRWSKRNTTQGRLDMRDEAIKYLVENKGWSKQEADKVFELNYKD